MEKKVNKTEIIKIRVTPEEKKNYVEETKKSKTSISKWARSILNNELTNVCIAEKKI